MRFNEILESEKLGWPVVLRAATDNQFAHMLAHVLHGKWVNGLVLAERSATTRFRVQVPEGYALRSFKAGDEQHISAIHFRAFNERVTLRNYRAWATQPNCRTFVVTHNSRPVGFIIAERRPYLSLGDFTIAVDPNHQGRGLGKALLRKAFRLFAEMRVRRVVADYLLLNSAAHKLYKRHGFKTGRAYNYFVVKEN